MLGRIAAWLGAPRLIEATGQAIGSIYDVVSGQAHARERQQLVSRAETQLAEIQHRRDIALINARREREREVLQAQERVVTEGIRAQERVANHYVDAKTEQYTRYTQNFVLNQEIVTHATKTIVLYTSAGGTVICALGAYLLTHANQQDPVIRMVSVLVTAAGALAAVVPPAFVLYSNLFSKAVLRPPELAAGNNEELAPEREPVNERQLLARQ